MIKSFKVWLRPLGTSCRVRVEGVGNATWLLSRLSRCFVFKTQESCVELDNSASTMFRVAYHRTMSRSSFETILASIPGVRLMHDPD